MPINYVCAKCDFKRDSSLYVSALTRDIYIEVTAVLHRRHESHYSAYICADTDTLLLF